MKRILLSLAILLTAASIVLAQSGGGTQHSVTLTWTLSTTPGILTNVYRGTTTGGPYILQNASPIPGSTYTDTTGVGGTKYFYVVTAVCTSACPTGVSGESVYSNESSATFLGNPAANTGLTASPK